jgi:hypothetical protein
MRHFRSVLLGDALRERAKRRTALARERYRAGVEAEERNDALVRATVPMNHAL